jgi:putative peptidoglycan lipid II flippase
MVALAIPLVDLIFTGGRFSAADARECAVYFAVFSVSMFLWSAQAIYARAFYAAGNTLLPMLAGTAVTLASLPVYAVLFHSFGAMGLAIASDIGIAIQTLALALLLHQKRMVSLASLDYAELGRCLLAALAGGGAVWAAFIVFSSRLMRLPAMQAMNGRWMDLVVLLAGTALWIAIAKGVLDRSGSALPRVIMKRLGIAA